MIRILGRNNSINVQKVMWCAAELNIEVDRHDIGMQFGGNDTPEYLAKNPNGLIPTLEDGDLVIWESHAIVRYLTDNYGTGDWVLNTPAERAIANQWMDWFVTTMSTPLTLVFKNLVRTREDKRDMNAVEDGIRDTNKLWKILNVHLEKRDYILGSNPSIADIPLGCAIYRWSAMGIERPSLNNVTAWYERLKQREPFQTNVMLPLT